MFVANVKTFQGYKMYGTRPFGTSLLWRVFLFWEMLGRHAYCIIVYVIVPV